MSEKALQMNAQVTLDLATTSEPPIDARILMGEGITRQIYLDNQVYTLRITRAGKLILTK
jgi:hemin uptake protein HemP